MKISLSAAIAAAVLYAVPAFAADMPQKAPVYKAPPLQAWTWTGFYAGVYAGVGLNHSHGFDPTGAAAGEIDYLGSGFTGGATVGYNWQFDPHWVAGIEGDIGWLGLSHSAPNFQDFTVNSKTSSLGTLRGRIGYTSTGATLAYVTAGAAWVHFDDQVYNPPGFSAESSKTKLGYAVGSGVETRLGGNWTAKSESLFVDVGSGDPVPTGAGTFLQTDKHRYLVQRFGVNYLFGGKPMAPLPQEHWQGFFIGAVGGTASPQTRVSSTDPTVAIGEIGNTGGSAGYTAGLIAGYNWQFAPQWVAGAEGDFSWLGINHSISDYDSPNAFYKLNTRWMATARARLGYSTGPALLYVTGGAAWVNYEESWHSDNSNPAFPTASSTKTLSGYAVGGGIETPFTFFGLLGPGLTARSEYLYVNVGNGDTLTQAGFPVVANHEFHLFRGAVLYRFGG